MRATTRGLDHSDEHQVLHEVKEILTNLSEKRRAPEEVKLAATARRGPSRTSATCTNCCTPLVGSRCSYCGHRPADDDVLLGPYPGSPIRPPPDGDWSPFSSGDVLRSLPSSDLPVGEDSSWEGDEMMLRPENSLAAAGGVPRGNEVATGSTGHWEEGLVGLEPSRPDDSCLRVPPVVLAYHEDMMKHESALPPHPERPARLHAPLAHLYRQGLWSRVRHCIGREARDRELRSVHDQDYIDSISGTSSSSSEHSMDHFGGQFFNHHTCRAAKLAAGTAAEVALQVLRGDASGGVALVRPGGHHAGRGQGGGGCYFNNIAVAAQAVLDRGVSRIMIVDWDIHHGQGTQEIFEDNPSVLYLSMHRFSSKPMFFPGTGSHEEVGRGRGEGFTVNLPWVPPTTRDVQGRAVPLASPIVGDGDYLAALQVIVVPLAYEFRPDMILVSAGFDGTRGDPVGQCRLSPECYAHMTAALQTVAPVVMILEGGYNLKATSKALEFCTRVLLGERPPGLTGSPHPGATGLNSLALTMSVHRKYWKCLQLVSQVAHSAPSMVSSTGSTTSEGQGKVAASNNGVSKANNGDSGRQGATVVNQVVSRGGSGGPQPGQQAIRLVEDPHRSSMQDSDHA